MECDKMEKTKVQIRNVDSKEYEKFQKEVIHRRGSLMGGRLGESLSEAMHEWRTMTPSKGHHGRMGVHPRMWVVDERVRAAENIALPGVIRMIIAETGAQDLRTVRKYVFFLDIRGAIALDEREKKNINTIIRAVIG